MLLSARGQIMPQPTTASLRLRIPGPPADTLANLSLPDAPLMAYFADERAKHRRILKAMGEIR